MNKFENILLFGIGINKFEITNWSEKKPKLLDLINLSDDDVIECQSDYFKYQARPPYLQQFGNILHDDLSNLVNTFTELLHERYQGEIPVKNLETWQLWSQRYTLGHYHGAHNHGMMNISCVLYVDFDVNEHKPTKFYSPFTNPYYGTVDVAGNLDVGAGIDVTGAVNVSTNLDVDGATTLDGLTVAEAADFSSDVDIDDTTQSTSTTSGALKVDGGVGVAKNLNVGGETVLQAVRIAGVSTISDNVNISGVTTTGENLGGFKRLVGAASSTVVSIAVTVATKTTDHRYFEQGSTYGYWLHGVE